MQYIIHYRDISASVSKQRVFATYGEAIAAAESLYNEIISYESFSAGEPGSGPTGRQHKEAPQIREGHPTTLDEYPVYRKLGKLTPFCGSVLVQSFEDPEEVSGIWSPELNTLQGPTPQPKRGRGRPRKMCF